MDGRRQVKQSKVAGLWLGPTWGKLAAMKNWIEKNGIVALLMVISFAIGVSLQIGIEGGLTVVREEFRAVFVFTFRDVVVPLGWPLLLGLALWKFRNQIEGAIDRLKKISKDGTEHYPPLQDAKSAADVELQSSSTSSEANQKVPYHDDYKPWVDVVDLEIAGLSDKEKGNLTERLRLGYAIALARSDVQQGARFIYGSQVGALKQIHSSGDGGSTEQELMHWFDKYKTRSNNKHDWRFIDWIGFLERMKFVLYDHEKYLITPEGSVFLNYLHGEKIDQDWGN